ncbi:hypothetical protein PG994_007214 [Apiospora phragmitis]|uniref:Uncharacterized protein n=1 Tax=Apiospora phragmitis TaxID=2905665 RepID=A0ABR1V056_9PEZI
MALIESTNREISNERQDCVPQWRRLVGQLLHIEVFGQRGLVGIMGIRGGPDRVHRAFFLSSRSAGGHGIDLESRASSGGPR